MPVVSLIKENDLIAGAVIRDLETGQEYQIKGLKCPDCRKWAFVTTRLNR